MITESIFFFHFLLLRLRRNIDYSKRSKSDTLSGNNLRFNSACVRYTLLCPATYIKFVLQGQNSLATGDETIY